MSADQYRKPTLAYISSAEAPRLYEAESVLEEAVDEVAKELSAALGFTASQKYTLAIPETLASLLEAYDSTASILAATAYLESQGYEVIKKASEE